MRLPLLVVAVVLAPLAACVPADESLPLGSAQFTITGRGSPRVLEGDRVLDGWSIHLDRFLVGFRTMTIVNLQSSDQCSYRGRGAATNVLFEAIEGTVVQAFNGIKPGACPDVGMRLGVPDDRTVLGDGATLEDLLSFVAGTPSLAKLEATATRPADPDTNEPAKTVHLSLFFDSVRTSTAFGGCRDATRGARIRPEARDGLYVSFALEAFFRDVISPTASLRFGPFAEADSLFGDRDGTVTMAELDAMRLRDVQLTHGGVYELPSGSRSGTFGDYVRAQFQFSLKFGEGGLCNGIEPGTDLDE
jgi:hypothetical protein